MHETEAFQESLLVPAHEERLPSFADTLPPHSLPPLEKTLSINALKYVLRLQNMEARVNYAVSVLDDLALGIGIDTRSSAALRRNAIMQAKVNHRTRKLPIRYPQAYSTQSRDEPRPTTHVHE